MWRSVEQWGPGAIGDGAGATAVVTGANSGIGFEIALGLAAAGAHVVLACRDRRAAATAADRIVGDVPSASLRIVTLDLASLASVRQAATVVNESLDRLDLLIDNAGVMATGDLRTEDGFELQLGTNHLGHFALTGLLLDLLLRTAGSRVVTVSSVLHRIGRLDPSRLGSTAGGRRGRHHPWRAYGDSKLANLLFAYELDRRLRAASATTISVAAHPGWARTNLVRGGAGPGVASRIRSRLLEVGGLFGAQSAAGGAAPVLYAATAPGIVGGEYVGPGGLLGQGPPTRASSSARSRRRDLAEALWAVSEELTGVRYDLPAPPPKSARRDASSSPDSRWSRNVPVARLTSRPSPSRTDASP
jgi:NAD(P)-dependent dehydrogenase (short-subunit alcohol dehydrogenase family)